MDGIQKYAYGKISRGGDNNKFRKKCTENTRKFKKRISK